MFFVAVNKAASAELLEKGLSINKDEWANTDHPTHGWPRRQHDNQGKCFLPEQNQKDLFWKASTGFERLKFSMSWPKLNKYTVCGTGKIHRDTRPWSNWNACM